MVELDPVLHDNVQRVFSSVFFSGTGHVLAFFFFRAFWNITDKITS